MVAMSVWKTFAGITAYVGAMGSGKTYCMTRDARRELRRGHEVWTNAGFAVILHNEQCAAAWLVERTRQRAALTAAGDDPDMVTRPDCDCRPRSTMYVTLSEMLLAPRGTRIYLDEVGTFMNARRWTELPRGLMYRLTQSRKDSIRLTYSAQHELQTDIALRRLTAIVYHCKRVGPLIIATGHPPHDFRRADDRQMDRRWQVIRKAVMHCYDTHSKVWVPPEVLEELSVETSKWVPLTDSMMADLRERVIAAREHPELAAAVDEATERALTDVTAGAHADGSTSGDAEGVANASSTTSRGLSAVVPDPRQGRRGSGNSQRAPGTNGKRGAGRGDSKSSKPADNSDVPSFYFDD